VDSASISHVAAALLYLASQYPLSIRLSGTLEQCVARTDEIKALLAKSRFNQPNFIYGIGGDLFTNMRGASLAMKELATRGDYAFKLHDFGFRGPVDQ